MEPVDLATAEYLIDFAAGKPELEALARQQLEGTLALHNKLVQHSVAYLADEVGMGKTYIALGVVSLMRRLNPKMRVLYLLPSNNVRDKWHKDYLCFIESNYRHVDLAVKGIQGRPAAPYAICRNLPDLVQSVATSSARDHLICTSAFSFALGSTAADLHNSLLQLDSLLPQYAARLTTLRRRIRDNLSQDRLVELKNEVKQHWAKAINMVLPCYDLVVVDEAHNLKKDKDSSARNRILATMLGGHDGMTCRIRRLLLLSATPYDRQLDHLRNQFGLFGFAEKASLPLGNQLTSPLTVAALQQLMVRRLNEIKLDGQRHTRNMYRHEYRTGEQAEVQMGVSQQLFAALVQKKVSEHLQENFAGRFELGMLASFESYLPGEKGRLIKFDGCDQPDSASEDNTRDARDRTVVEHLVESYWQTFDKRMPPHPKMDWVTAQLSKLAFAEGSKQLVFVRRVSSVAELKLKLDEAYDDWLAPWLAQDKAVSDWFDFYRANARERTRGIVANIAEGDEEQSATGENFFTWFYRGRNPELDSKAAGPDQPVLGVLPHNYRTMLAQNSRMFEASWNRLAGMPQGVRVAWNDLIPRSEKRRATAQLRFRLAQYAWLKTVAQSVGSPAGQVAKRILEEVFPDCQDGLGIDLADRSVLEDDLAHETLWDGLRGKPSLAVLVPDWGQEAFSILAGPEAAARRFLHRQLVHMDLVGVVCRLDHPFIDLYSLRGSRKEEGSADRQLTTAFIRLLERQAEQQVPFCSYQILLDLVSNLDLLVKLNFPEALNIGSGELTKYLTRQLSPLAPVSGASGENSRDRTPLARKFRMPGYPRVLVSTDVFQEGEDLHTFCDSVMHYGISSNPIALEQKAGRVDRVASLAHRNMIANQEDCEQHFIKVRYPHIRQSLEFFQVRQSAANLNAFLRSLNRLDADTLPAEEVDLKKHLSCDSPVELHLREPLHSLFPVRQADLDGRQLRSRLEKEHFQVDKRLKHVRTLVDHVFTDWQQDTSLECHESGIRWKMVFRRPIATDPSQTGIATLSLKLHSAAALPELLLAASSQTGCLTDQMPDKELSSGKRRIAWLQSLQAEWKVRMQLYETRDNGWMLSRNAEVYAGRSRVLIRQEVIDLCSRVLAIDHHALSQNDDCALFEQIEALCGEQDGFRVQRSSKYVLRYDFQSEGRTQKVRWTVRDGYLLISSRVLTAERTLKLARSGKSLVDSSLVACTLLRNARFDLVDFHVNNRGELSVRACHPLGHLNNEELAFMARSVAAEADRLEQILKGNDKENDEE